MNPALSMGDYDNAVKIGAADLGLALSQQAAMDYNKENWNGWKSGATMAFVFAFFGFVAAIFIHP